MGRFLTEMDIAGKDGTCMNELENKLNQIVERIDAIRGRL